MFGVGVGGVNLEKVVCSGGGMERTNSRGNEVS